MHSNVTKTMLPAKSRPHFSWATLYIQCLWLVLVEVGYDYAKSEAEKQAAKQLEIIAIEAYKKSHAEKLVEASQSCANHSHYWSLKLISINRSCRNVIQRIKIPKASYFSSKIKCVFNVWNLRFYVWCRRR